MKSILRILAAGVFAAIALSCVSPTKSLTEPGDKYKNLVVGSITFEASNFDDFSHARVSGVHRSKIKFVLYNITAKSKHEVFTYGDKGLFYAGNLPAGKYAVYSLAYDVSTGNARSWLTAGQNELGVFEIQDGQVNNLGSFSWKAVGVKQGEKGYERTTTFDSSLSSEGGYSDVRDLYADVYKESGWNDFPWAEVAVPKVK